MQFSKVAYALAGKQKVFGDKMKNMTTTWSIINAVMLQLRNDYRLKENIDYSILHKYEKTAITCIAAYLENIKEIATKHGLVVDYFFILPNNF